MNAKISEIKNRVLAAEKGLDPAIIRTLAQNKVNLFHLPGEKIFSKAEFLKTAARVFSFPDYFGENWDAFEECLNDLDWSPLEEYIVVYDQWEAFQKADPEGFETARDILKTAVENRADQGITLHLVLERNRSVFART